MADIVGRGQVQLLLPYVRGTGGLSYPRHLPPHTNTVLRPRLSALRRPAFSTFRNDTSSTGPILEERKCEDRRCVQVVAGARLTTAREHHQDLGGERASLEAAYKQYAGSVEECCVVKFD